MSSWSEYLRKYFKLSKYGLGALGLIGLAVMLRILLVCLGWPLLDSDEGTWGLMAMHIAYRGEHPIFFYAQGYMGAFESYLAAGLFRLFGVSTLTLRLGLILMFAAFLLGMYLLTSLLYSKKFALVTLVLLTLGSNAVLTRELAVLGGDPETLLCGAFIMLLAVWLALSSRPDRSTRNQGRRLLAFGAWGFAVGFGIWSHLIILPFVFVGGLILLAFCWREIISWAPLCLPVGLIVGALPFIIYNLQAAPGKDTLTLLWKVNRSFGITQPPLALLLPQEIKGALLVSLPTSTNANPLCPVADVHLWQFDNLNAIRCTLVHTGWSIGVLALWAVAAWLALRELWLYWRLSRSGMWSLDERQGTILSFSRLALLVGSAITFLLYMFSPSPALFPVATSRYLVGFLITTPALLWPLWHEARLMKPIALRFVRLAGNIYLKRVGAILRRAILLGIGLVFLLGTVSTFTGIPAGPSLDPQHDIYVTQYTDRHLDVPETQALNRQEAYLIQTLVRLKAVHVYSDYWTCDRIIFQSREQVICSAVSNRLGPGHDRYMPYRRIVTSDPHSSYVFRTFSPMVSAFERRMATSPHYRHYKRIAIDGYVIYQPPS
ncbi:hypothetical protein EPA93_42455 [Ktedonosporobacter rubrisoli]|uniref:Glycosyltransferase RgtA/B/C/D-like domain-containing protein n=1 Tax=Ktedonosporobacter rubrisoli TaxID=2509675 RepID=A0A4P6K2C5_KTERU|nr:hypothetical protein [Ktedonosporobacter rubrisoli]QBD82289.1 hypothetical protein EPA93_42455 [Ktedonosporobacter rubrisoli]